jgi:hypothetical protein
LHDRAKKSYPTVPLLRKKKEIELPTWVFIVEGSHDNWHNSNISTRMLAGNQPYQESLLCTACTVGSSDFQKIS